MLAPAVSIAPGFSRVQLEFPAKLQLLHGISSKAMVTASNQAGNLKASTPATRGPGFPQILKQAAPMHRESNRQHAGA
jgi:hypothetical protein